MRVVYELPEHFIEAEWKPRSGATAPKGALHSLALGDEAP